MLLRARSSFMVELGMFEGLGDDWPLIRYVRGDLVYRVQYQHELQTAIDGPLEMIALFQEMDDCNSLIAA